jgi:AcrR family transcriptional regulator
MREPPDSGTAEVLDRALAAFWRLGYEACSIAQLVKSTGLQRQSLYNRFGDKEALLVAVLRRYRAHSSAELRRLDHPDATLSDLRTYMERVLAIQSERGCGACLLVRTSFSHQMRLRPVRRSVLAGAREVRARFAKTIERAVGRGEVPKETNPEQCAAYLYTVLNGLAALAGTGGTSEQVAEVLSHTFRTIERSCNP